MIFAKWAVGPFLFLSFNIFAADKTCFDFAGEVIYLPKVGTKTICWNSRTVLQGDSGPYELHCQADPAIILEDGSGAYAITSRLCNASQPDPNDPTDPNNPDNPPPVAPDKTTLTKAMAGLYYEMRSVNQAVRSNLIDSIERTAMEMNNYAFSNAMQIKNSLELSIKPHLSNLNTSFDQYKTTATEFFAQSLLNQDAEKSELMKLDTKLGSMMMNSDIASMQLTNIDSKLESLVDIGTFIMNKPTGGGGGGGGGGGATSADIAAIKADLSKAAYFQPDIATNTQNSANSLMNIENDVRNTRLGMESLLGLHRNTLYDIQSNLKKIADSNSNGGGGSDGGSGGGNNPNPVDYTDKIKSVENAVSGLSNSVQGIKDQLGIDSNKLDGIKGSLDNGVSKLSSIQSDIKTLSDFVTDKEVPDGKSFAESVSLPDYEKYATDAIEKISGEVEKHSEQSGFSKLSDKSNFNNMFSSATSISQIFAISQAGCTSIDFGSNAQLDLCEYSSNISNVLEFVIWALTILFCFTYTTSLLTRERLT
jgi:hypothetical protein